MRVLIIMEAAGGVARHVSDLCCGLTASGIDVHLVYSPLREDAVLEDGLKRLANAGVKLKPLPMDRSLGLPDFSTLAKLWSYAKNNGPFDIVHGHSSKGGGLARLLSITGKSAAVYSPHAFVTMDPQLGQTRHVLFSLLERFLGCLTDAVITSSFAEDRHAKRDLKIPGKKVFLVPNGIESMLSGTEESRKRLRSSWGVDDREIVIGAVMRFEKQKAPDILLEAFSELTIKFDKIKLLMVGDGPLRSDLEALAAKLNIANRVVWPGYLNGNDVMSAFDIFALSSRYEGFPYVLLDALASGLPVVAPEVGGVDMTVENGVNGFIVTQENSHELSAALSKVVSSDVLRRSMGAASLEKLSNFKISVMLEKTLNIYEAVLSGSHSA